MDFRKRIGAEWLGALVITPALLLGPLAQQDGDDLAILRSEVQAQSQELELLRTELAATRGLVDETLRYTKAQAGAAKDLAGVLVEVEANGFTAGINARSREILLAGLRGFLATHQVGVPGVKPEPKPE